jgi:hypothetical protein
VIALARDVSDRLSPILVKELRQGVRAHLFTGAFLLQQLLLLAVVSFSLLLENSPGDREAFTFFFWAFVTLPLVIVIPLGAGASISGELAGNTFEPVLLTRLTAWRLVAGKWAASASQAVVLAIAVLPFLLVRYYLGTVEITNDLMFLGANVGCSLLLASVSVAVSPAGLSALFRWALMAILALTLGISFLVTLGEAAYARMIAMASAGIDVGSSILAFLGVAAMAVLAALEASALQVAPVASARPLRLRLLALLALLAAAGTSLFLPANDIREMAILWALGLAGVTMVAGVCEQAPLLRARYAGFYRKRFLVPLGWFLAPGWPAGVGFLLVCAGGAAVATAAVYDVDTAALVLGSLLGSLLLPLVVWRTFFPRARAFLMFLLVTLVSALLSTIAPIAMSLHDTQLWRIGCLVLPLCPAAYGPARLSWYGDYGDYPATVLPVHSDVIFAAFVVVVTAAALWHTVRAWRQIGRLVRPQPSA